MSGARKIDAVVLFTPPLLIMLLAAVLYSLRYWNILVFWHSLVTITFIVVGFACVAAEIILVPATLIKMYREPKLKTGTNTLGVGLGLFVLGLYPASFFMLMR